MDTEHRLRVACDVLCAVSGPGPGTASSALLHSTLERDELALLLSSQVTQTRETSFSINRFMKG